MAQTQEVCDADTALTYDAYETGRIIAFCKANDNGESCGYKAEVNVIQGNSRHTATGRYFDPDREDWYVAWSDMEQYHRAHIRHRNQMKIQNMAVAG